MVQGSAQGRPIAAACCPGLRERFSDFDATNTRAVLMFRAKVRFDNRGMDEIALIHPLISFTWKF